MIRVFLIAAMLHPVCQAQTAPTLAASSTRTGTANFTAPPATSVPEGIHIPSHLPTTTPEHDGVRVAENFLNATLSTTVLPSTATAAASDTKFTRPQETSSAFVMPVVDALVANEAASFSTSRDASVNTSSTSAPRTPSSSEPPTTAEEASSSTDGIAEASTLASAYDPFADLVRVFLNPDPSFRSPHVESGFEDSQMHRDAPFFTGERDSEAASRNSELKNHREDGVPSTTEAPAYDMSRERYCTAARYCYKELNERCITRHMRTVCGCGRAFFRNPETLICERKLPLVTSLELPHQSYVQEVADKKSAEFKLFESASQQLVREEAEPLAFPPLASYEPDDQALWKLYESDLNTTPRPPTAIS